MSDKVRYTLIPLSIVLIPIIFLASLYLTAPSPGFCVSQNRLITDAEFIKVSTGERQAYQKIIDGNPSVLACCNVERVDGNLLSKIFRADEGVWVSWSYEMDEEGIQKLASPGEKHYSISHLLDSCASRVLETRGITQK